MTWHLEPSTFGLYGGIAPSTLEGFAEQQWPPCPVCGTTIEVDAISVPDLGIPSAKWAYVMGEWHCPHGCDPKRRSPEELAGHTGLWLGEPFRFRRETTNKDELLNQPKIDNILQQVGQGHAVCSPHEGCQAVVDRHRAGGKVTGTMIEIKRTIGAVLRRWGTKLSTHYEGTVMKYHPLDLPSFLWRDYCDWQRGRRIRKWKRYIAHIARQQNRKLANIPREYP
jgi:hypothetical protein